MNTVALTALVRDDLNSLFRTVGLNALITVEVTQDGITAHHTNDEEKNEICSYTADQLTKLRVSDMALGIVEQLVDIEHECAIPNDSVWPIAKLGAYLALMRQISTTESFYGSITAGDLR